MKKSKTFNECYNGSVRNAVAEFIDNSTLLSHFKGEQYFELEDSIVDLIRSITSDCKKTNPLT